MDAEPVEAFLGSALTRREALAAFGALGLGIVVAGCSSGSGSASPPTGKRRATATSAPTAASTATPGAATTCTLAPEVTQGPFYLTDHPDTPDLVHDRPGRPLALTLTVVDTKSAVLAGVKVDVWHCDTTGVYGGIGNAAGGGGGGGGGGGAGGPGSGDFGAATRGTSATWLQGYQTTGADGTVHFRTIYPGWYPGRAVHIHMKVFVGATSVHTGQLFFPDGLTATVFRDAPYRGTPDTLNRADSIYTSAGSAALLAPTTDGTSYAAIAQLVVRA